jgi:hypothetical protein
VRRRSERKVLKIRLVGCGIVSTGKGDFPQDSITYIFRIEQWKNNGFLFKKTGKI